MFARYFFGKNGLFESVVDLHQRVFDEAAAILGAGRSYLALSESVFLPLVINIENNQTTDTVTSMPTAAERI